jgi:hypothetical protein
MDEKLTLNALRLMFHGLMGLLLGPFNGCEEVGLVASPSLRLAWEQTC